MINSVLKVITGIVKLRGATDDTEIGNSSNRLLVQNKVYEKETYVVLATDVVLGNGKSMVAVLNGAGSGRIIRVHKAKLINARTTNVTGVVTDFRVRRITNLSAGTAITPLSMDTLDSLPAQVIAATGGTVTEVAGDLMRYLWSSDEWGAGTVDVEAQDHGPQSLIPFYETLDGTKPITLREGQGLTVRCNTNTTAGTFDLELWISEETI